jgi:Do/DeqQ family serine protease
MRKNLILSGVVALVVSILSIGVSKYLFSDSRTVKIEHVQSVPSDNILYSLDEKNNPVPLDFTTTAQNVLDGVVHIKSTHIFSNNRNQPFDNNTPYRDPFEDLFGDQFKDFFGSPFRFYNPSRPENPQSPPTRVGAGSGVIISEDGYIVTNNHVIADADDIEVTLHDNRTYKAKIIGTDPSTDLALIQIKEDGLSKVGFSNSDNVQIGQWVMAVGNPFSLNSTVTAGIVSAKGRNINILKEQYAIEDFIQTDAAINPGNSGGALVNLEGSLIGINTAIASPTGAYSGYGFAVPSNIVSKVVEDLLKYGVVQRGVLGITIRTVDGNLMKEKELKALKGVYVDSIMDNSAASKAGVLSGDVITHVNGNEVTTSPQLQGMIARYRPGDKVNLILDRKGQEKNIEVTLQNREGNMDLVEKESRELFNILGAELNEIEKDKARKLDIKGGVQVKKLYAGKLKKYTQMRDGFIITKVDGKNISSVDDLKNALSSKKGGVMLEGIYEDIPGVYYYAFGLT